MKLYLRAKLAISFGVIFLLLLASTTYNFISIAKTEAINKNIIDHRFVTVSVGKDIVKDINQSLAALRGYMILGANAEKAKVMKSHRALAWEHIAKNLDKLTELSTYWTDQNNVKVLSDLKHSLALFEVSQQKVEDVAQRPENIPSYKLLLDKAQPLAEDILSDLTNLIDIESTLPASEQRKAFFKNLADSRGSFAVGIANIRAYLLSGKDEFKVKFEKKWAINTARFDAIESQYTSMMTLSQFNIWSDYRKKRALFSSLPAQMFAQRSAVDWNQANYILSVEAAPHAETSLNLLVKMRASQDKLLNNDILLLAETTSAQHVALIAVGITSLLISVFSAVWFSNDLLSRLMPLLKKALEISANDLSTPKIIVKGHDEISDLTIAVNSMNDSLKSTLKDASGSMRNVSTDAGNIYQANSDMSKEIEVQAHQISMIVSSTEELSSSATQVSAHSLEAANSAENSLQIAEQGGVLVRSSLVQMSAISDAFNDSSQSISSLSERSKEVENILGLITGIAEQTNLLALNAAIEAARAGEQGRGFAVVADEVRQLATRTTNATSDVKNAIDLMREDTSLAVESISAGLEKVIHGVEVSNEVAEIFSQIVDCAKDVASKVETISCASDQQSKMATEISGNTEKASKASENISATITDVVLMAKNVSLSCTTRADKLEEMMHI